MKAKNNKVIYLVQIKENALSVVKCLLSNAHKRNFTDLEVETIETALDTKKLGEKLNQILRKLGYNNNPVIVSLLRSQATLRYLKVPTQEPAEIERIISLQASHYLPYPANELITGYQIIATDREGYSEVNLVIVHKNAIEHYIKVFAEINIKNIKIILSSYGLTNLLSYIEPGETQVTMAVDIALPRVELAIIERDRLLFSRSFNIAQKEQNWQNVLVEEINKTKDAYLKEISRKEPNKIVLVGATKNFGKLAEILGKQLALPIQELSYWDKIKVSEKFLNRIPALDDSLAALTGLGLKDIPDSLNLLPQNIKEVSKKTLQRQEIFRQSAFIFCILLILGLGVAKNLHNKEMYLKLLRGELKKIEQEAKSLEEIEKRFAYLENRLQKRPSSLDILYEIHQNIPAQISLINFIYEEDNQVSLHGQAPELNSVFDFVSRLEKSATFKNFNIKVRYATKKKIQSQEVIDFEIACIKK
jgi:Tfp pilus assembly PilM family ATPase/Tfp pilus assembly protein PilN